MRKFVPLFAATLLSGCGVVPPLIGLASYALDGVSLAASGRTVTDHALSMAANQDCKLYRLGQDREVCTDWGTEPQVVIREVRSPDLPDELLVARGEPMRLPSEMADVAQALPGVATAEPVPVLQTALAPPPPKPGPSRLNMTALVPSAPERAVVAASPAPVVAPAAPADIRVAVRRDDAKAQRDVARAAQETRYLMVIGSFKGPEMAEKLARLHAGSAAKVMTAEVHGQTYFRVVVDPSRGAALAAKLAKTGDKPWIMPASQMQQVALATTLR